MSVLLQAISSFANVVMAVGVFFVWKQIRLMKAQMHDDHERSRKQVVIDVMRSWNQEVGPATAAAQKLVARLDTEACRTLATLQPTMIPEECFPLAFAAFEGELKREELEEASVKGRLELSVERTAHLRFLIIEYLNGLEIALSAWKLGIAETEFMENEFSFLTDNSMTDPSLATFRKILGKNDGFPSLRAFLAHVKSNNPEGPDGKLGKH